MTGRYNTSRLKPGIWFVAGRRKSRVVPVTREGFGVVIRYILGMVGSGLLVGGLAAWTGQLAWLAVMPIGMGASAFWFLRTAFKHADRNIDVRDLLVKE